MNIDLNIPDTFDDDDDILVKFGDQMEKDMEGIESIIQEDEDILHPSGCAPHTQMTKWNVITTVTLWPGKNVKKKVCIHSQVVEYLLRIFDVACYTEGSKNDHVFQSSGLGIWVFMQNFFPVCVKQLSIYLYRFSYEQSFVI